MATSVGAIMMKRVGIISYGMGNIRSVCNAVEVAGGSAFVAETPAEIAAADALILPGVGAFGEAMARLNRSGWIDALSAHALGAQRPFLGICLGMQLLATRGTEFGVTKGLGWVEGTAEQLRPASQVRIPHMGWNEVRVIRPSRLLEAGTPPATCYFVHSFAFVPSEPLVTTATTEYGATDFVSVVERDNIFGVQFHPEKSQKHGISIIKRFLEL